MWGYYGSKSKLAHLYPAPTETTIIEPFAGTAQYALRYWDRRVILIEKYDVIVRLWRWLQSCSPADILGIRRLTCGQNVDDFEWDCDEQKWLVGFIIVGAPTMPKKTASRWKTVVRPNTQNVRLESIAGSLHKIRHWDVLCGSWEDAPDIRATWFIDPPYTKGGEYYKYGNKGIDYALLAGWAKSRKGQVIVCEKTGADWLPFRHLAHSRGAKFQHAEAVWVQNAGLDVQSVVRAE